MISKLMLMGAASALLVSFACGCVAETGSDEGTPANEKVGTEKSAIIYGNPAGYNPPGYNPMAPGLNPPGYNPPGMGVGVGYPGEGIANPPGYNPPGYNPAAPLANPPGYNPPGTF